KITRVAQSAEGKARDVRHWKRRGARFRHPRRQQGSATVRAIHYKMDHARSDWHGRALGFKLMQTLISCANRRGIGTLYGDVLHENTTMRQIARGHCHVGQFYLSMARRAYGPHTAKSMACRVREWRWTPREPAILGRRDNAAGLA